MLGCAPGCRTLDWVFLEELVEELRRSFHNNEAAVIGACVGKVDNSLDTAEAAAFGCLVDVWPGLGVVGADNGLGKRDVHGVEGNHELFGFP